jgi:hypothetical protein
MISRLTQKTSTALAIALLVPAVLAAQGRLSAPMDPDAGRRLIESARAAQQESNSATALRDYGRAVEFYPNEPLLRAPLYRAMSDAARKSGDSKLAGEYLAMANALDTGGAKPAGATTAAVTRGKEETIGAVGEGALNMLTAILRVREQAKQAKLMKLQVAQQQQQMAQQQLAQQQLSQQQMAQQQVAQQQIAQQQMAPPQMPQQQAYAYPPAPVGQPGYQPPPAGYAPMPGYAPTPGYAAAPVQFDPNAQVSYTPPPQTYVPPPQYAQPQYAPAPAYSAQVAAQVPQQPVYQPPQPVYYPQQQPAAYPQGYAPAPAPYGAPQGYMPAPGATRGEAVQPIRIVHDHALLGDDAYFRHSCGALLSIDGAVLAFTSSAGEIPLLIPSSEIQDIRLNVAAGKEVGAFHIVTRKGLYLNLAVESGKREDSRAVVEQLRGRLRLGE